MKIGQRFRFNNLTQTYAKYKDIFRKKLRQKEEGTVQRHFGAAAKAIEAERAKAAEAAQADTATAVAEAPAAFRIVCSHPDQEAEKVDRLFQAFVDAKKSAGEKVDKLSHAGFAEFVRKKTKDLQKQNASADVEYVVETIDGQVKLKALVKA